MIIKFQKWKQANDCLSHLIAIKPKGEVFCNQNAYRMGIGQMIYVLFHQKQGLPPYNITWSDL